LLGFAKRIAKKILPELVVDALRSIQIVSWGKKAVWSAVDIPLRNRLRSQPRAPRSTVAVRDLASYSALVVTAHPDDEVIAAGVMLCRLKQAGVICLTNGAPFNEKYAFQCGFDNRLDYAAARQREAEAALALTGRKFVPHCNVDVADLEAALNLVSLTRYLCHRFRLGFDYIITHAYEGGHPDHDAAAFCVHAACALISKEGGTPPVIVEAPFYNAPGGVIRTNQFLTHGDAGPVACFKLSPAEQLLKTRMFDCFVSQRKVLTQFDLTEEKFRQAPRYHFAAEPDAEGAGLDKFGWELNGRKWRMHAWRAMRELDLMRELA
jgi:N-acetylglucosamine malate deacetylase 2